MSYTEQSLLVTTVGDDRTIVLPDSVPSGATVGIVVLSTATVPALTRKERFKAALVEIEAAIPTANAIPFSCLRIMTLTSSLNTPAKRCS